MSELLYQCMTKATRVRSGQLTYGLHWALSRRAFLKIFEDRLECGNWRIPYSDIRKAVLCSLRTIFFRVPGYILTIETDERIYHFGLNGWGQFWLGDLPFPVKRESGKPQLSWFSIVVRLILLGAIVFNLWQWISSRTSPP
ncbi:hypothetical protein [Planctomicrobium sp. SH664]|uniref:hypothetical protein n=1 Tax=Planctomicrobium sp. SH664 TaxID=3448125 RepID=UPI003F5B546F